MCDARWQCVVFLSLFDKLYNVCIYFFTASAACIREMPKTKIRICNFNANFMNFPMGAANNSKIKLK